MKKMMPGRIWINSNRLSEQALVTRYLKIFEFVNISVNVQKEQL